MGRPGRYAVISDVHANIEALRSVLSEIKKREIQDIFFLGDAVGYGPDPNACVELLRSECEFLIAGNHDWGLLGLTDTESFNESARFTLEWTRAVLRSENRDVLSAIPLKTELPEESITLVHATPYEPEQWHYLFAVSDAETSFKSLQTEICFLGHSHRPFIIRKEPSGTISTCKGKTEKEEGCRYIVNAGSVGQPRDGDPRACLVVVDGSSMELIRTEYNIRATQKTMEDFGLPQPLIERLSYGL